MGECVTVLLLISIPQWYDKRCGIGILLTTGGIISIPQWYDKRGVCACAKAAKIEFQFHNGTIKGSTCFLGN